MTSFFRFSLLLTLHCALWSCQQKPDTQQEDTGSSPVQEGSNPAEVRTLLLKPGPFHKELLANGKLAAPRKANLKFKGDGPIVWLGIRDGEQVRAGQLLARLDSSTATHVLRQARLNLQKAQLDYADQLLRAGYQLRDTARLDRSIKDIARLRSGLSAAEVTWQQNLEDLRNTRLVAPFNGKIANVNAKAYNNSSAYEFICTLVDDSRLDADFLVLEQELPFVRASRQVTVIPFSGDSTRYTGEVSSINPLIDEAGMVSVKASIHNPGRQLLDGMRVRVLLQQTLPGQLVVPKEAVLDRQGRKVVFTAADTLAKWNYVEIAAENSSQYAIREGLKAGDLVIVDGNFNLAHDKMIHITAKDPVK